MSKKLITIVLLCLLSVCIGFLLGVKMSSVPEHQPSKENPLSRLESAQDSSGSNLRTRSEPQLLRFEAGGGYALPEKTSLPFETYGLDEKDSHCVEYKFVDGKLQVSSVFGSHLFVDKDPHYNLVRWLFAVDFAKSNETVVILKGRLKGAQDKVGIRIVFRSDKVRNASEKLLPNLDTSLAENGYPGFGKGTILLESVYAWEKSENR